MIAESFKIICTEINTDPLGIGYSGMTPQEIADSLNASITITQAVSQDAVSDWLFKYRVLTGLVANNYKDSELYTDCEMLLIGSQQTVDVDNTGIQEIMTLLVALDIVEQSAVDEFNALKNVTTTRAKQLGYDKTVQAESVSTCLAG